MIAQYFQRALGYHGVRTYKHYFCFCLGFRRLINLSILGVRVFGQTKGAERERDTSAYKNRVQIKSEIVQRKKKENKKANKKG